MRELTTPEWLTYNYLKERTQQDLWTTQEDLHEYLKTKTYDVELRQVRKYIYNIRRCDKIQKIVISSSKGYKIMTNFADQLIYLEKMKIKHLKGLKQYYKDMDRLSKDGQTKITFSKYERDHIEALLK